MGTKLNINFTHSEKLFIFVARGKLQEISNFYLILFCLKTGTCPVALAMRGGLDLCFQCHV